MVVLSRPLSPRRRRARVRTGPGVGTFRASARGTMVGGEGRSPVEELPEPTCTVPAALPCWLRPRQQSSRRQSSRALALLGTSCSSDGPASTTNPGERAFSRKLPDRDLHEPASLPCWLCARQRQWPEMPSCRSGAGRAMFAHVRGPALPDARQPEGLTGPAGMLYVRG